MVSNCPGKITESSDKANLVEGAPFVVDCSCVTSVGRWRSGCSRYSPPVSLYTVDQSEENDYSACHRHTSPYRGVSTSMAH
ncbi:hypothetical protein J6590_070592 [Homalodisca vitripennis]|nr:hypothetical protein J6590_070592 [Homalodisca vitripennis]